MTRILALLCLLLVVFPGCLAKSELRVEALRPSYLDAIKPIQIKREGLSEYDHEKLHAEGIFFSEEAEFINVCTASSINRNAYLWITAAHCVSDIGPEGRYIEGTPIEPIEVKQEYDLAVFRAPLFMAKELTWQIKTPSWGQEIVVAGHPLGYADIFVTRGYIGNPKVSLNPGDPQYHMVLDVTGAPGSSGSPVMNLAGEMVSVIQTGWVRGTFGPISGGATAEEMRWFHRYFTPRSNLFAEPFIGFENWPHLDYLREPF